MAGFGSYGGSKVGFAPNVGFVDPGVKTLEEIFGAGNFYDWDAQNSLLNPKQAADFNGSNQFLGSASTDFDKGNESFSFGGWWYSDLIPANNEAFMGKWDATGNNRSFLLWKDSGNSLNINIASDGSASVNVDTGIVVSATTWYFIVGVYDATNNVLKISVNGSYFYVISHSGGAYASSTADFEIGRYNGGGSPFYLDGRTDECFFIDRALKYEEVVEMYNSGNGVNYTTFSDGSLNGNTQAVGKYFDGTDDAYNINTVLTGSLSATTTGSWSAWVRPVDATPTANEFLIGFGDTDASTSIRCGIVTTGVFRLFAVSAGVTQFQIDTDASAFTDNTWTHIAIVQDGVSPVLYVNGSAPAQTLTNSTSLGFWFSGTAIDNGRLSCTNAGGAGDANFFNGDIQGATFHTDALTGAEVLALYNSGSGVAYSSLATTIDGVAGNNSYYFDGTEDAFNINNVLTGSLSNDTTGTLCAWVRPVDATPVSANRIISFGDTNADRRIDISITTTGTCYAIVRDPADSKSVIETDNPVFSDNTWVHIAWVQDGVSPTVYVNGVAVAQTLSGSAHGEWFNDTVGLDNGRIGALNFNSGGDITRMNGDIDEVSIHADALTAAEISAMYNSGSGKKYSELSTDIDGVAGQNAYYFDGSADAFDITNVLTGSLSATTTGSWACWINVDSLGTAYVIASVVENKASAVDSIQYSVDATGSLSAVSQLAGVAQWSVTTDSVVITAGSWHHVAVVQDGTSPVLYVDGSAVAQTFSVSTDKTYWVNDMVDKDWMTIGAFRKTTLSSLFLGDIDEVMIYDTDLSAAEVLALYNSGNGVAYSDLSAAQKTNLVAYYDMKDVEDNHTNNYDLTPIDNPVPSVGKVNDQTMDVTTNLVAYYTMKDLQDSHTNNYDLTPIANPLPNDGKVNDQTMDVTTNLVAYYDMTEVEGANIVDEVNSYAGTPVSIPVSNTGKLVETTISGIATSLVSWWEFDATPNVTADAHGTNTLTNNNSVAEADGKVIGVINNNDPVFRWNDGGSNDKDFEQSTLANRPIYLSSGINSLPGVDFEESASEFMDCGTVSDFTFMHDGTQSWASFMVFNMESDTGASMQLFNTAPLSGTGKGITCFIDSGTRTVTTRVGTGVANRINYTSSGALSVGADSWIIVGYNATSGDYEFYINSSTLETATPSGALASGDSDNALRIARRVTTGLNFDGVIGQYTVGTGVAPSTVFSKINKLITNNWGI